MIKKKIETIEDLIFDSEFAELSVRNDQSEIEEFISLHSDRQEEIRSALVLLQHVNVNFYEVSDSQIGEDWNKISQRIGIRKKKKKYLRTYIGGIIAACAVILLIIFFKPNSTPININEKDNLLSLIESGDISSDEVQIIAGKNQTNINNDETIIQTQAGNVVVGSDSKMVSKDIETEYLTVVVPKGRRTTIKFSDGTTVWVNSGSKVVYPKVFGKKNREIVINGEIYLDVAKDLDRPFVVHTVKGFDVSVLGTKFNISAYSSDVDNSVVLVDGSVEVITKDSKGQLIPNQGFFMNDKSCVVKNVNVYPYICWKDNVMSLNGESLDIILKKLGRHYGVDIQFSEKYTNEKYKGKIDLKEPIETVLANISVSTPMDYSVNGDIVIVK